jgi:hypothetical protein
LHVCCVLPKTYCVPNLRAPGSSLPGNDMDIQELIARNRKPLPQVGQKVETPTAW